MCQLKGNYTNNGKYKVQPTANAHTHTPKTHTPIQTRTHTNACTHWF